MHETPHTDSYVNTAANTLRRLQQQQQKTRTSVHLHGKVHELHETFHVIPLPHILMWQRTHRLIHSQWWNRFTQLSHAALTDNARACTRATPGQQIGKSKWHGSKARGNQRLEEMKRVKRKEGKREGAAECATDGVDCKRGSDTCSLYSMCSGWRRKEH